MCIICENQNNLETIIDKEILYCVGCPTLTTIPTTLVNVRTIDLTGCRNLISVKELPGLESLNCWKCPNLSEIRDLPSLRRLKLNYCDSIQSIHSLSELVSLSVNSCQGLIAITDLQNLKKLYCSFCDVLTTIDRVPMVRKFTRAECEALVVYPVIEFIPGIARFLRLETRQEPRQVPVYGEIVPPHMLALFQQAKVEDRECVICREEISEDMCMTKCFHLFHRACLSRVREDTCPTCRAKM
jgi:hypothetical protein